MNIEKFIERKIPGLNVLRLSSSTYLPGAIIDTKKNDLRVGHAKDIFKDVPAAQDIHPALIHNLAEIHPLPKPSTSLHFS